MNRLEAAEKGERFFQTKPCKIDGDVNRYTAGAQCVTCSKRRGQAKNSQMQALIAQGKRG